MSNEFAWFHNSSEKPSESVAFYEKLLGWKSAAGPPGMSMLTREGAPFAAVMPKKGKVSGWVPYVQVDDVAAATNRAVKLGAELLEDPTRGPAGIYSIVRDPGGATVALWQKA
ncbi:MAG TPA: VOC family protein [Polyangiaceae bacterium]|nr:VOC family protein [Polyangiaceae bacterium]